MRRVDIISKVVGRDGQGKPVGGGISIPMGNYALKSDFESLKSMFNDFLEGDDTDSVINRWKDLEAFLNGISEDNTLDSILKAYVTLSGNQTITGEKNFVGGLKVNGSPIYYDTEKKYWKLEGDLLVTGGVTMYGNDSDFVASTIMDAILYDDTTLGINAQGQLYVKGSVGGATTLGSLANVGSWADSVASQDRIMYQAANSSLWIAKNLSDLAVGGVTGNYLPLSGGTINGSGDYLYVPLYINALNNQISGITFKTNGAERGHVGYSSGLGIRLHSSTTAGISVSDSDEPIFYVADGSIKNTIWHSGNDGSGSGLDADLLDGKHYSDIVNGNVASATRIQAYQHNSGENVLISGTRTDNTYPRYIYDNGWGLCLRWQEGNGVVHNGTIATLNDNVASATKLATARTIWGQSFDGTGNVDGDLTANGNITMRTGTAFDASKYLTLTNNASQYGRIGIHFNGSTQDGNDHWGDGGRSIITFRRKYGTATSYTYSYAIQHNLVDDTLGILYGSNVGILLNNSGNVGIGTTNPESYKLYVNGSIYSIGSYRSAAMIYATGALRSDTGLELYQATPYIDFHFNSSTADYTTRIIESSSGVLTLIGRLTVTGGVTMYSDIRKKTKLKDVVLSLQQVANAPLIEHYYNSDQNKTTHVGSIAQYWAEMNDWFCKKDSEGYYTMEIQNAALASAISVARELVKFESETDRRIRLLEDENKRLKEEIEQLKWNIA